MKRNFWGCLALAAALGFLVVTGCSKKADSASVSKGLRIGIVCSAAGQNDNGYNQSAVSGLKEVAAEIGAEYKVVEPQNGVPAAI